MILEMGGSLAKISRATKDRLHLQLDGETEFYRAISMLDSFQCDNGNWNERARLYYLAEVFR